ncbi:hypothetical protein M409DRAFT_69461 [Zasmidium cellare ATCC 36951]|uniref:GCN5-related N-acetyltransferase Rv2170-like domain-containing protein n=1 Tax=Zasmidium cellare ATCC 36951 TaxID=1080233 RepID=A0A6A6C7S3_ZASCE|nr:uncharacterized protein M409DRAFT_69461 [Zasmidium cellare ATCC 36951]KAF2161952.1 hypothetical protein M409DRAFT_69461 [Zasmidium cellare ATCC 36951]
MPSKPQIYSHALHPSSPSSKTTISNALALLRPYLPTSIPLYRRLQFGRFFPDSRLLTNLPNLERRPGEGDEWILTFIDRTPRPETECWIFASWETSPSPSTPQNEGIQNALMTSLFHKIRSLPLPPSIHSQSLLTNDAEKDHTNTSRADYAAHIQSPDILLCGAVHEAIIPALQRTGLIKQVFLAGLVPNHAFVFRLDEEPLRVLLERDGEVEGLPEGLRWGELEGRHFGLVRSRTQIPRQEATLAVLPNVGIFPSTNDGEGDGEPVAWAFVGVDGSLSTLHVEPEWRGKGLAKRVTAKLFGDKMGRFWEDGVPRFAHDYVIKGNTASVGVGSSIGGRSDWDVYWVRVDLSVIGN